MKLKTGDKVKITAGKDKGKEGVIERVYTSTQKVLVPGVNMYKKHVKASQVARGQKGGVYDLPRPLSVAKVSLICPKCKKQTRIGYKVTGDTKTRICRKCEKVIDTTSKKTTKKSK